MSTYIDDFSNSATFQDNWTQITSGDIFRPWHVVQEESYYLRPTLNPSLPTQGDGIIIYNTPLDANFDVSVRYEDLNLYNGDDNSIVFRYTDRDNYYSFHINPGGPDESGVYLDLNDLSSSADSYFEDIVRITPSIPISGTVRLVVENDFLRVFIYDTLDQLTTSASSTLDNHLGVAGYVGFGKDDSYDVNFGNPSITVHGGWDAITATDLGAMPIPPQITSFSATDYNIVAGNTTDLGWTVNSGSDATIVEIDNGVGIVPINGISTVNPVVNTTYNISATSVAGMNIDSLDITIVNTLPTITSFVNSGPVTVGQSATLDWATLDATNTYIFPTIGQVVPVSAGSVGILLPTVTTQYTLCAADDDNEFVTSQTTLEIYDSPSINSFTTTAPVCSGSTFDLSWTLNQYVTSAYITDIGAVSVPSGVSVIPATDNVQHQLSAFNAIGDMVTSNVFSEVYTQPPFAFAGPDLNAVSSGGVPVDVLFDGTGSTDPQFLDITYDWQYQNTTFGTSALATNYFTSGTHDVTLTVTNTCGFSATDDITVNVVQVNYPVAIAMSDISLVGSPTLVNFIGSNSYAINSTIESYTWRLNGQVVSSTVDFSYLVDQNGINEFVLEVRDSDNRRSTDSVSILYDEQFQLSADAGPDQLHCIPPFGRIDITLDGSNSRVGGLIDWYEWDLSEFGVPNQSGTVSATTDVITAFVPNVARGTYNPILAISGTGGLMDDDSVTVIVGNPPTITIHDQSITLVGTETVTSITMGLITNASNSFVEWYGPSGWYLTGNPASRSFAIGSYDVSAVVTNLDTTCSAMDIMNIQVVPSGFRITDFYVTPDFVVGGAGTSVPVTITWQTVGADATYIEFGLQGQPPISGFPDVANGTSNVNLTNGQYEFNITAYDTSGSSITERTFGSYITVNDPLIPDDPTIVTICETKDEYITTYGIEEIRYGKDRLIDLVNYLPEYVKEDEISQVVKEFQDYLNEMYQGQHSYQVDERELPITECNTPFIPASATGTSASDGCGFFDIGNTYNTDLSAYNTNAYETAGDVFIANACSDCDTSDKISILEKIFRLTDLFDPDLIPIELLQFYADNLGYNVGINREALVFSTDDKKAQEMEQKRYLRFMVRNLPNWYKIKSTRPSIKILLYSFGLIGDFVYYYTTDYNKSENDRKFGGLCGVDTDIGLDDALNKDTSIAYRQCVLNTFGDDIEYINFLNARDDLLTDGNISGEDYPAIIQSLISAYKLDAEDILERFDQFLECFDLFSSNGEIDYEDIVDLKCNLTQFVNNSEEYNTILNSVTGDNAGNWELSDVDNISIFEDNRNIPPNFFATPHFNLWIDIADSSGSIASPEAAGRREMLTEAIMSVKPINTVFHGIQLFFDAGKADMIIKTYADVHEYIVPR